MKNSNSLTMWVRITASAMKNKAHGFRLQSKKKAESKVPPIRRWDSDRLGTAYRDGNGWYRATPME